MLKTRQIVMIGTKSNANGGIASVISAYEQNGLFSRRNIIYLSTHSTGKKTEKLSLFASSSIRFIGLLMRRRIALVHVHVACDMSFWRKTIFLLGAKISGVPALLHIHAGHFPEFYRDRCNVFGKLTIRLVLNNVDHIAVVSKALDTWIRTVSSPKSMVAIKNPAVFATNTVECARESSTLLFLGHMSKGKGVYDLIHAMQLVKAIVPEARLLLCGDGDLLAIKNLVEELSLVSSIEILGWIDQRKRTDLLAASTIFVLPSYAEGTPMSLLEAMASRLPVVATTVGGIPEAIGHERDGLLVEAGDVPALASSIVRLLLNPVERSRLAESAFIRARNEFGSKHAILSLENLYDRIEAGGVEILIKEGKTDAESLTTKF